MNGTLTLIFMSNYGKFLLVDDKMLHSTYLQMFVLGNYDESLFEPVDLTPLLEGKADVHEAMMAMQKVDLSMRLLLTVRNKVIEAYKEIMHMQF